ncbi:hypothetical protein BCV72DRAFT_298427, partial [Rhizopus microsporus var. microsporus]
MIEKDKCVYTKCYCEENIYMLCKEIDEKYPEMLDKFTVVFISNDERKIPMWAQKSCVDDYPIVWDYHVILLFSGDNGLFVYDFDTKLPFPCKAEKYMMESFKPQFILQSKYERYFRLIPARSYLYYFASDRSHMIGADGAYHSEPPKYDPIVSKDQQKMNLDSYISMKENSIDKYGRVISSEEMFALAGIMMYE